MDGRRATPSPAPFAACPPPESLPSARCHSTTRPSQQQYSVGLPLDSALALTDSLARPRSLGMPPKLTNPLRPVARYRKGQAPVNAGIASDSDSDQEEQQDEQEQVKAESSDDNDKPTLSGRRGTSSGRGKMNVALREVEVDSSGQVKVGGKGEVGRTAEEEGSSEYGQSSLGRALQRLLDDTDRA